MSGSSCSRSALAWWVILRPLIVLGRTSTARTQRGSVRPLSTIGRHQVSLAPAFWVHGTERMIRSGSRWPYCLATCHVCSVGQVFSAGMSLGSPCGAPRSTHFRMVAIWSSLSERSFLNSWMPMVLSMCHGGIWRASTRARIERAHGRASAKLRSDIGPIDSGRWQASHLAWKIGAMSLVKVGASGTWPATGGGAASAPTSAIDPPRHQKPRFRMAYS